MLESPSFSLVDEHEVQMNFAFHMFGSDVESLELQYADNTSWKALWHRSGNQGQAPCFGPFAATRRGSALRGHDGCSEFGEGHGA